MVLRNYKALYDVFRSGPFSLFLVAIERRALRGILVEIL